ncbi:hypothetical protein [uncultured Parabacteroides sp.]|uniref:hypothetical protein n=1 Tax=uncultured Parabacteroides sp. TaxID=512312 RepID=UPI0026147B62|nr:hypothetical protein [uncultured Parabacteroides sp.]
MDLLIQKERTGSPERFAKKVELSRSTFFEYISYLRNELMLQINYDEYRETYYYEGDSIMDVFGKIRCESCKVRMCCEAIA